MVPLTITVQQNSYITLSYMSTLNEKNDQPSNRSSELAGNTSQL